MATTPDTPAANTTPAAGPDATAMDQAHADYVHDQLQQERTVYDHSATLKARAPARIAAVKHARTAAGLSPAPSAADDGTAHFHVVARMLNEQAFYPAHDKRTESPDYAKVHHQMTVVDDKHCIVCGVQHSTLADAAKNPFGAIQLETHHHTIEWALANAIDAAKFNQHVRPGLLHQAQRRKTEPGYDATPEVYRTFDALYENDMSLDVIKQWIDHGADNLWVLCDVHHRHKFVGIHAISYPIWGPQDVVSPDLMAKQIELAKTKNDPAPPPAGSTPDPTATDSAATGGAATQGAATQGAAAAATPVAPGGHTHGHGHGHAPAHGAATPAAPGAE